MKLLECSDQTIQLKGYSKTANFSLKSIDDKLYVNFKVRIHIKQIESYPSGEFIVIP
jgi:hypothetical protein